MERKIGEIFEYNGEWYQCIVGNGCENCAFNERKCYTVVDNGDPIGDCCADRRKDNKDAIFKKLEKAGEPFLYKGKQMQSYIRATDELICNWNNNLLLLEHGDSDIIDIEIKQNKEDMEEKKLNLKPFDIQKAREGKPVCTRDGRKARIICFDRKFYHDGYNYPIVAMVNDNDNELVHAYTQDGLLVGNMECDLDLMMLPEKRIGWININKDASLFKSKEEAERNCTENYTPVRVEFEI